MYYDLLHPREQLVMLMARVYQYGMTTTSGGNMSIRTENGDIWITPAAVDKGALTWDDIVCMRADGTVEGKYPPSSEYPFHQAIYKVRPDLSGIVHAHPSALVAFSIVRQIPPTRIIPQASDVCGQVGYAPYDLPGSRGLGEKIANAFARKADTIILENHGVVCGGRSLLHAFHRFETLDYCARVAIKAKMLGGYNELSEEQINLFTSSKNYLVEFEPLLRSNSEKAGRREIREFVRRAYGQQIMTSTGGVVSLRLNSESFLITPTDKDRKLLDIGDIVLIHDRERERGKLPSRSVLLHDRIYRDHPEVNAIVSAQAPNATAFAVSGYPFDTRTIPESYIMLRDIPQIPYEHLYTDEGLISQ